MPLPPERFERAVGPEKPPLEPMNPDPLRVVVREVPPPGEEPKLEEEAFEDARSIAAARKSRPGGYLRLTLHAAKALGKSAVILEKVMRGTDLILRIRLFPTPARPLFPSPARTR
jgi:hypothetical protein